MDQQTTNLAVLAGYVTSNKLTGIEQGRYATSNSLIEQLYQLLKKQRGSEQAASVWTHYTLAFGKRRAEKCIYRDCFLLYDQKAFKGNTLARSSYVNKLVSNGWGLTAFQKEAAIGLILSDTSSSTNKPGGDMRLKMQQSSARYPGIMQHIWNLFYEFTGFGALGVVSGRKDMYEFQTLTCPIFNAQLFQGVGRKAVLPSLAPFITPVSLAYWWIGDGGKLDADPAKGKGISLHTQAFTQSECLFLANCIESNLGLKATVKLDYVSKKGGIETERFRIDLAGASYDRFIEIVGPYIPAPMHKKLPPPRVDNSRFGIANAAYVKEFLGSKWVTNEVIESYKEEVTS